MTPQESIYNKVRFNGFHVTYFNHERNVIDQQSFPDAKDVEARGFTDGFPDARSFAEDLYNVFGDEVGLVVDNAGAILYDKRADMHRTYDELNNW